MNKYTTDGSRCWAYVEFRQLEFRPHIPAFEGVEAHKILESFKTISSYNTHMNFPDDADYQLDNALRDRLNAACSLNQQNPTPENRASCEQAFRVFADWVLRGKL